MKKSTKQKSGSPITGDQWKKIKTWKDVCRVNGNKEALPKLLEIEPELRPRMIADYMMMKIAKALNGSWKVNYKDHDQYKYTIWNRVNKSGSGFAGTSYDYWVTAATVGSRLCFESVEKALHAAKYFKKVCINHQLK